MSLQVLLAHLLTLSPSATSQIFSSVTGFIVGNVFPLTESTNSLLIKTYLIEEKFFIIKLLAILSTYIKSQFFKLKKSRLLQQNTSQETPLTPIAAADCFASCETIVSRGLAPVTSSNVVPSVFLLPPYCKMRRRCRRLITSS